MMKHGTPAISGSIEKLGCLDLASTGAVGTGRCETAEIAFRTTGFVVACGRTMMAGRVSVTGVVVTGFGCGWVTAEVTVFPFAFGTVTLPIQTMRIRPSGRQNRVFE